MYSWSQSCITYRGVVMSLYIVWVGGIPDYEGDSLQEARAIYKKWVDLGYDDVILENAKGESNA